MNHRIVWAKVVKRWFLLKRELSSLSTTLSNSIVTTTRVSSPLSFILCKRNPYIVHTHTHAHAHAHTHCIQCYTLVCYHSGHDASNPVELSIALTALFLETFVNFLEQFLSTQLPAGIVSCESFSHMYLAYIHVH